MCPLLSTITSEDQSSCRVQYTFHFVNKVLDAASKKAIAIVQPQEIKTVNQNN